MIPQSDALLLVILTLNDELIHLGHSHPFFKDLQLSITLLNLLHLISDGLFVGTGCELLRS